MFTPGTILALKDIPENDNVQSAYRRVEVIGTSPGNGHGLPWQGAEAQGVLIRPLEDFGGVLDQPLGRLNKQYTVEFIPEVTTPSPQAVRVIDATTNSAGLTPEQQFDALAEAQKAVPKVKSPRQKAAAR